MPCQLLPLDSDSELHTALAGQCQWQEVFKMAQLHAAGSRLSSLQTAALDRRSSPKRSARPRSDPPCTWAAFQPRIARFRSLGSGGGVSAGVPRYLSIHQAWVMLSSRSLNIAKLLSGVSRPLLSPVSGRSSTQSRAMSASTDIKVTPPCKFCEQLLIS
jgi:hypothetical protein